MGEYVTLGIYVGMLFIVVVGGLLWKRYRVTIKRRLDLEEYQHSTKHHTA
jgi:hypothetical protein